MSDLLCSVSERWGAVVQRSMEARQEMLPAPNAVARDMFACIWGPVTAAIYSGVVEQSIVVLNIMVAFDAAEGPHVLSIALQGFNSCASIAAHHHMDDVLDNLIV